MIIRPYQVTDEIGWLECRVLAFLDTSYYDNVLNKKETYDNPSIELIAEVDGKIIGLIDVELEEKPGTVCSSTAVQSGMIWHIAVHPRFRRQGIGKLLLKETEKILMENNIFRIEAWTRDDNWVINWYERNKFMKKEAYLHIFMDSEEELKGNIKSLNEDLFPVLAFAHYIGDDHDGMKKKFKRVHECSMYERFIVEHPIS